MTKNFCDICGNPAVPLSRQPAARLPVGEPHFDLRDLYTGPGQPKVQCHATIAMTFGFECHPSDFGGPPDLCATHARELIQKALESIRDET